MITDKKLKLIFIVLLAGLIAVPQFAMPCKAFASENDEAVTAEETLRELPQTAEGEEPGDETEPVDVTESVDETGEEIVIETSLKGVAATHEKSYRRTIKDTITVTPAYGRSVELYRYDKFSKEWVLERTYTTENQETSKVTIKYPKVWKAYSASTWKIVVPEMRLTEPGSDVTDVFTRTIKKVRIKNKIAAAKAAIIIDAKTGEVLYAQKPHKHLKVGSLTKMTTAMIVMDKSKYNSTVKITSEAVAARKMSGGMYLVKGDKVRMEHLVHAMLMCSANDAAAAAACGVSGNQKKFAVLMDQKAKSLGANESTFRYAFGDWHSDTYSTAYDQALIGAAFMTKSKYKKLRAIVKKGSYSFRTSRYNKYYSVHMGGMSTVLIKNGRSIGIKSGYSPPAGYCYANCWKHDGRKYISIVLGASSSSRLFSSQKALMKLGDYLVDHNGTRITL